jgi:hypothetical protein
MAAETSAGRIPGWTRHFPLRDEPWDAAAAEGFIVEIAADAFANFNAKTFWPSHPLDELSDEAATSLYMRAVGTIWGLDYLRRQGAIQSAHDFAPALPPLFAANASEFAQGPCSQRSTSGGSLSSAPAFVLSFGSSSAALSCQQRSRFGRSSCSSPCATHRRVPQGDVARSSLTSRSET